MLMLTCARFWNSRTGKGVFALTWQQLQPSPDGNSPQSVRFHMLRMLEYDGMLSRYGQGKYCCWGCMAQHDREAFSCEEMARKVDLKANGNLVSGQDESRRYCLATKKCFRLVCQEFSFNEVKNVITTTSRTFPCGSDRGVFIICLHHGDMIYYELVVARLHDFDLLGGLPAHLRAINIPLCPHICLGSPKVVKLYSKVTPDRMLFPVYSSSLKCKHCKTRVRLDTSRGDIRFYIYRYIGRLKSPRDPAWLAHSFSSKDCYIDAHCQSFKHWICTVCDPIRYGRVEPTTLPVKFEPGCPRPDFSRLFTPVTLPRHGCRRRFCKRMLL